MKFHPPAKKLDRNSHIHLFRFPSSSHRSSAEYEEPRTSAESPILETGHSTWSHMHCIILPLFTDIKCHMPDFWCARLNYLESLILWHVPIYNVIKQFSVTYYLLANFYYTPAQYIYVNKVCLEFIEPK